VNTLLLNQQCDKLALSYPRLCLTQREDKTWVVAGQLRFRAEYKGEQVDDEYTVEIFIPEEYPSFPPMARETGGRIPRDFHHSEDELCLGALPAIAQTFSQEPTLLGFINNSLIPYLYSYSYKCQFGNLPFGELAHGWRGILEYYQDLFQITDRKAVLNLLKIVAQNKYRGHIPCPCGSQKRLRACHGETLRLLIGILPTAWYQREFVIITRGMSNKTN
jgi:hypothetical protein